MSEFGGKIFIRDGKTFVQHPNESALEVKYGLPPDVIFCRQCVISNQRAAPSVLASDKPDALKSTIPFSDDRLCDACRVVERKDEIDWGARERELLAVLDRYRSRNGSHDCLVPGSGGKDSVYAAHILKTKYDMHPLTVTWAPHIYTEVGWRNFQRWINVGGFDNYLFTPNGIVHRKLTRLAYENLLHPFQPFIYGQRNFPVKFAETTALKLVFYGENAAEYGAGTGEDAVSDVPPRYYTGDPDGEVHISGVPVDDLAGHGIPRGALEPYMPMPYDRVRGAGIEVHYLGHFLRWTPQECYYYAAEHIGFEANDERTDGTYSKYNSIDDRVDGFHYWTGFVKFGIGRCTHEASQEIRHRHITREEGVALVHKFDGEFPNTYFRDVLEYLDMEEDEFLEVADRFRSPHLWQKTNEGWALRYRVS